MNIVRSWKIIIHEKQIVNNSVPLMKFGGSLQCSQEPVTES